MVHGAIRAQAENVQPVLAPRGHCRRAGEHSAQPFPVGQRRPPRRAVPGLVVHGAIRAQAENVQPVLAPRGDPCVGGRRWQGENVDAVLASDCHVLPGDRRSDDVDLGIAWKPSGQTRSGPAQSSRGRVQCVQGRLVGRHEDDVVHYSGRTRDQLLGGCVHRRLGDRIAAHAVIEDIRLPGIRQRVVPLEGAHERRGGSIDGAAPAAQAHEQIAQSEMDGRRAVDSRVVFRGPPRRPGIHSGKRLMGIVILVGQKLLPTPFRHGVRVEKDVVTVLAANTHDPIRAARKHGRPGRHVHVVVGRPVTIRRGGLPEPMPRPGVGIECQHSAGIRSIRQRTIGIGVTCPEDDAIGDGIVSRG